MKPYSTDHKVGSTIDLDKPATIDALRDKYRELEQDRNEMIEMSISTAVKAERLRCMQIAIKHGCGEVAGEILNGEEGK